MKLTPGSSKLRRLAGAVLSLILFAGLGVYVTRAYKEKIPPEHLAQSVNRLPPGAETAPMEWIASTRMIEAVGTVRAKHEILISSKILARVDRILVRAGDVVRRGDLLVQLDPGELIAQKAAARAVLEAAEADRNLNRKDFVRRRELFQRDAVSRHEYDVAQRALEAAEAAVKGAEEEIAVVDSRLGFTRIYAPADGKVIERLSEPGDMAVSGRALLSMYDPSNLRLEADIPESVLSCITHAQDIDMVIPALDFRGIGKVEEIVPQASESSRSFTVKVSLPDEGRLYPGMFGRIEIPCGRIQRLLVPAQSVRHVGQVRLLDVVAPDDTVTRVQVQTGKVVGDRVEVLSGVDPPKGSDVPPRVILH